MRTITERGVAVTEQAGEALTRVDRTMDQLGRVASNFQPDQSTGMVRLEATRGDALRADLNFDLVWGPDPSAAWRVGVRGLGAQETLNLQRSVPLGREAWLRAGVFGSKPGVALNYRFSPSGVVELEAWHPGENRLDLRTYWQLRDNYLLTAGVARFLRDNDPFIGLERVIYRSPRPLPRQAPEK